MQIKIDTREKDLFIKLSNIIKTDINLKEIQLISETLLVGDVILFDEINQKDIIIIERKSINDLLSSIKDGRYEEQSYRLNGIDHHNHNIIYLIEGSINNYTKDKQTIYSAMFSLFFYKGFSVLRSLNMDETAIIICNMIYKLEKEKQHNKMPYYKDCQLSIDCEQFSDKNYINLVKKCKKDNITIDNIDEIMLCQIPGVSSVAATAIIAKFGNILELIKEFEIDKNCLNDICYKNTKDQLRKINKTSITNIVKYLMKK